MRMRNRFFGYVFTASGARNFFGEGWMPYHKYCKWLFPWGFNFAGATLITKTTTLNPRMPGKNEKGMGKGNLVLNPKTLQPAEFMPDCVKVDFLNGRAWNVVGLTGPGAEALFERGVWQQATEPLLISFMAIGKDREERLQETKEFTRIFKQHLPHFSTTVGLEINDSCPNVEQGKHEMDVDEILEQLEITLNLGVPQGMKINVLMPEWAMSRVAMNGHLDFIDIPNTLPVGEFLKYSDWKKEVPLRHYGGGSYSGRENFVLATEWVRRFRERNNHTDIILGGVFSKEDVCLAKSVGANAVSLGRVVMTRPWRVAGLIKEANQVFGGAELK